MAESVPGHPVLLPLGDRGLLVRFATTLSDAANRAAIAFADRIEAERPPGVAEVQANLVSVLLTYDPREISFERLAGEIRLRFAHLPADRQAPPRTITIPVRFGGEAGPDFDDVSRVLNLSPADFITAHNASRLRVLATGFAPGFVYCGFHPEALAIPRRTTVRAVVPAGTVLFAAGQTAIAATPIPTGWHVIGHTEFLNFDPSATPPTTLRAGDEIRFEAIA